MLALKKVLANNLSIHRREVRLMGNKFEISVVGNDPVWAGERINSAIAEINRVEKLLSTFSEDSEINTINRNAGIKPVKVSAEIFKLIDRSLQISELTYGAFDITYYTTEKTEGDTDLAVATYTTVNYKDVVLDTKATTVFLKEKGMRIGFGANSKGYAADRAKYILQFEGVSNGVINAGGDLLTWGLQPDMEPWTVATADPRQKGQPLANLDITNMAIATSVNTEKYATISDKKLSTSKPANGFAISEIKSVSIISPTAEFADAMATPVMTIGINAGIYLINQLNQLGCVIIDDHSRVYPSKGINLQ
ncbi:FAD:protein FMN transferase [Mucilaginibacter sp. UR6-11]|uniref:FAD:protein FMN transferase n=1 Tax=Mucilaginibacter sp. UR6-11 TaxID=1435644 RepID=UPI001E2A590C|nr:FAD:protein FMN transferase [Mucilaginibacter sp. UR6-11]MCC8427295.1 FAD:protein FMN transferase [Mucilaginibacter sp. UR6-11]